MLEFKYEHFNLFSPSIRDILGRSMCGEVFKQKTFVQNIGRFLKKHGSGCFLRFYASVFGALDSGGPQCLDIRLQGISNPDGLDGSNERWIKNFGFDKDWSFW